MSRARAWIFVVNNPGDYIPPFTEDMQYLAYELEHEEEEKKTTHWQGWVYFKNAQTLKGCKKKLDCQKAHLEIMRGTPEQNNKYCSKEGKLVEFGQKPKNLGGQRRSDREKLDLIWKHVQEGKRRRWFLDNEPELFRYHTVYYHECVEEMEAELDRADHEEWAADYKDKPLRPNQEEWLRLLDAQDNRTITWICDNGNTGKSWFAMWLEVNRGAYAALNGKTSDVMNLWNREKIIAFDFNRSNLERLNYSAIEEMKNGRFTCHKYHGKKRRKKGVKIICFANEMPDQSKLTADRWEIKCDLVAGNTIPQLGRKRRIGEIETSVDDEPVPKMFRIVVPSVD